MDKGIRIPEDISIVGFDDAAVASLIRPKLTTVHQNPTQKAYIAIAKLIKLINNPDEKTENITLPISLCIRQSVKKISS